MSRSQEFSKGVWKQQPLIHTPDELKDIAKENLSPHHPELGKTGDWRDPSHPGNNQARQSMQQFQTMKSKNLHLYRADKEGNLDPNQ